jgi:hypothetical protein
MKKILVVLGLLFIVFVTLFPLLALAEGTTDASQPYDWLKLGTVPGAIAATLLVLQYWKMPLDKVWKLPTRLVVFVIAFGILTAAKAATDGIVQSDWLLLGINTFVVGVGAMGAYELSFAKANATK